MEVVTRALANEESGKFDRIPWFKMLFELGFVNDAIMQHDYIGSGTAQDPYIVVFFEKDPRDPMKFPAWMRWMMCFIVSLVTLSVSFLSSAYSAGIPQIKADLGGSETQSILGVSLFVLGFACGPFLWAPLSELYGRQYLFWITYSIHTAFNAGICAAQNISTLLVLRFLAGAFGSAPLTNSGGVIADSFPAADRGFALMIFSLGPLFGPILGPIVGGFVSARVGWRWLMGVMAIFTGTLLIIGIFTLPETYGPVILRHRAKTLSETTGKVYKSHIDATTVGVKPSQAFNKALIRPWSLLFREPIVLLLSIYQSIAVGIVYLLFAAFPIVYQQARGWSQELSGLAFLGVMIGDLIGWAYATWDNKRFMRVCKQDPSGFAPPEARLPPSCIGAFAIPIGLFWFAWTNAPELNFLISIAAGIPLGAGIIMMFISVQNYLVDAYTIYAASVLAGGVFLRSIFAAAFPLFTTYMYRNLGIHWASCIPAFLSLLCTPLPILFYKYGKAIRARCKYAKEADLAVKKLRGRDSEDSSTSEESDTKTEVSDIA